MEAKHLIWYIQNLNQHLLCCPKNTLVLLLELLIKLTAVSFLLFGDKSGRESRCGCTAFPEERGAGRGLAGCATAAGRQEAKAWGSWLLISARLILAVDSWVVNFGLHPSTYLSGKLVNLEDKVIDHFKW